MIVVVWFGTLRLVMVMAAHYDQTGAVDDCLVLLHIVRCMYIRFNQ